jgi:hypothetical protein
MKTIFSNVDFENANGGCKIEESPKYIYVSQLTNVQGHYDIKMRFDKSQKEELLNAANTHRVIDFEIFNNGKMISKTKIE